MDTQALIDNLIKLMTHHDWLYEYNDNYREWSWGHAQSQKIYHAFVELEKADEKLAVQTWNKYAPANWQK